MKTITYRSLLLVLLSAIPWQVLTPHAAADSLWQGGIGDFNNPSAWNQGVVPTAGSTGTQNAVNDSGSNNVVLIQPGDPVWNPWDIRAGNGNNTSGAFRQTGDTVNIGGWFRLAVGTASAGYYTLSNGVVNCASQAHIGETGTGVLEIDGGTFTVGQSPFCLGDGDFGASPVGILKMNGGTLTTASGVEFWIGEGHNGGIGGTGTMMMTGGAVNAGSWFAVGRFGGIGDLELSGGSITMSPGNGGNFTVATSPSTGVVNQSGGAVTNTVTQTWIAETGTGTWNLTGGSDVFGVVHLTHGASANGRFNLNGGDLFAKEITDNGGNGIFNFNGGTLHAVTNALSLLHGVNGSVNVKSGGAFINTEGYDATISQTLVDGGGGLTKFGIGCLTLAGNLNYSGVTTISNGTLMVTAPTTFNSPTCNVSGGAALGVRLLSAGAQLSVPTLALAAAGSGLSFDFSGLGGQATAPLHVGSFAVNGPVSVSIAGFHFSTGQFPLVQYTSRTGGGSFTLSSIPQGMVAQLVTNVPNKSIDLVITTAPVGLPWQMKQAALMTDWAQQVNPTNVLAEYPRPQMQRTNWMNLNGVWEWQAGSAGDPVPTNDLAGTILVPFCMESAISGVMETHDHAWYERTFSVPTNWAGQHVLLHFEAVDWECEPFLNGVSLGIHQGGYDPFTYDITAYLTNSGSQKLIVRIYDPTDAAGQPRGKQTLYPGGIMYTPCSGIWQPVWLEPVPATSISSIHLVPDIDNNRLLVNVAVSGRTNNLSVNAVAFDGTNQVAAANGAPGSNFYLSIPSPKLWSPTNPFLYDLKLTLKTNATPLDSVASYFGMRKVSLGTNNGFLKIFLNNQFAFGFGPLDQGFWPDGIYTAPTDLALKYDIESDKAMGFNLIRKHIKVERQRWYYWADRLGVMVWQDMPSVNSYGGNQPIMTNQYKAELERMVTNHWNSPAIVSWVIFNESQGQHDTASLVADVEGLDPSRIVNQASGGSYFDVGDILDWHSYPNPSCPSSPSQAVVCGEFGGVGLGVTNHTWAAGWGYVGATDGTNLTSQFEGFCGMLNGFVTDSGLSAAIYTQITDVETELNGLNTYDRKVYKPILRRMQTAINSLMGQYSNTVVVPSSQPAGQNWKYTFTSPASNWFTNNFNDSTWTNGVGGFGTAGTPGAVVNTTWNSADIWMRRTFNPGALTPQQITNLSFSLYHDEGCEIYINGVLAASASGYITAYSHLAMNTAGQNAIVPNANNLLAVHCHQTGGGQAIDVGIDLTAVIVPPPPVIVPTWPENGAGLTAEYFSDTNLASRVFVRTDTNVNFNWSLGSPGGGLASNRFSVRWTGKVQPRYTEGYTFHLTADDGCRLWVDGQLLIDKWRDDSSTDASGSIALTGGRQYDLRIEYYDNTNAASAKLEWQSASQLREVVPQGVLFPANTPPNLAAIPDASLIAGQTLLVTNTATDAEVPPQTLAWSLTNSPAGALINSSNGVLTWRPAIAQSPSTNTFTVIVTDNGTPALSATRSFKVMVLKPTTPVLSSSLVSGGNFYSIVNGSVGPDYSVFSATNLQNGWLLLLVTNPTAMPFSFIDSAFTNSPQRFYRVLLGP